jgi:predicted amidophosphoribosyltransferase
MLNLPMNSSDSKNLCPNCGASLPLNSALVCPMCVLQATESHAALFSPANVRYPSIKVGDTEVTCVAPEEEPVRDRREWR